MPSFQTWYTADVLTAKHKPMVRLFSAQGDAVLLHPSSFSTQLYMLRTGFGSGRGQRSQLCPLPAPCASPLHSLVGWWGEQKALTLWALLNSNETISELSKLFSTNPNHEPTSATVKKINALSTKTNTLSKRARTTKFSCGRSVFLGIQVFSEKFYFVYFF